MSSTDSLQNSKPKTGMLRTAPWWLPMLRVMIWNAQANLGLSLETTIRLTA